MSRIKRKPHKSFCIEDAFLQDAGKAIRINSKIFSRRYLTVAHNDRSVCGATQGRDIFLERHPEFNKYLITDERYAKNVGSLFMLQIKDEEECQKFLDVFYLEEDKFSGVNGHRVMCSECTGTLYPLRVIGTERGSRAGFPVSPIIFKEITDDLFVHEMIHAMSRDVTIRLFRNRDMFGYFSSFLKRTYRAEEILAYLGASVITKINKKKFDLSSDRLIRFGVRAYIRKSIRRFVHTMNRCIVDNTKAELDFMVYVGMADNNSYRLKFRKQIRGIRRGV